MSVVVADQTNAGRETARLLLEGVTATTTLRELIRLRVREEVARYNASLPGVFQGLVQPSDSEVALNGYRLRQSRRLDWEQQADAAETAFQRNGFFVFVRDRQVEDLDEPLALADADVVTFVKLVPLVGG